MVKPQLATATQNLWTAYWPPPDHACHPHPFPSSFSFVSFHIFPGVPPHAWATRAPIDVEQSPAPSDEGRQPVVIDVDVVDAVPDASIDEASIIRSLSLLRWQIKGGSWNSPGTRRSTPNSTSPLKFLENQRRAQLAQRKPRPARRGGPPTRRPTAQAGQSLGHLATKLEKRGGLVVLGEAVGAEDFGRQ